MTTRKIITIDETKCNGCGNCISGCAEGALQLVNGKAKLVKEQFCDGFGDCIGTCPTGALKIEEKTVPAFDIEAVRRNLLETQGIDAVKRMEQANRAHDQGEHPAPPQAAAPHVHHALHAPAHGSGMGGGCPGTRMRMPSPANKATTPPPVSSGGLPPQMMPSALEQWPVQLHLVQSGAPFFNQRELVVLSTCAPVASADVHWRFLKGRSVVVACPKLDNTEPYAAKLGEIIKNTTIPKVLIVRMEVPCCGGLTRIVQEARRLSQRQDLIVEEVTVGLGGDILSAVPV